ncbi:MAG: leucine-rich repeat domain-containing protein, partial [Clostridia bacterium]|nr:leucine-rich repeat domain-containing protein [Clostridia bacterium]
MKKAVKVAIFTVLFIAVCAGALFGYMKYNESDFVFAKGTKSGTLELKSYSGDAKNIIIPSSYHGKKVAYIAKEAFMDDDIVSVTLPDSIVKIGESAFAGCEKLEKVEFGKGLENLDAFAFRGCSLLQKVEFNSAIKGFDGSVFANCSNLKEIIFPESADFVLIDKVVFSKDKTIAVWSPADVDLNKFSFPESVKKYSAFFFYGHDEITSFELPQGTTAVERGLFADCKNLEKVTLPDTVKKIDHSAFYNCTSLKSINLPASVSSIGDTVFVSDSLKNLD